MISSTKLPKCNEKERIAFITKSSFQFGSVYLQAKAVKEYLDEQGFRSSFYSTSDFTKAALDSDVFSVQQAIAIHFESFDPKLLSWQLYRAQRKVLIYHGITPAKYFLFTKPQTALLSLLGQLQLRLASKIFGIATADSPFTVLELQRIGFANTIWLPCYIQPHDHEFHAEEPDQPFELLFIGRIVENKGILQLLKAVTKIAQVSAKAIRLTIVGTVNQNSTYGKQVLSAIEQMNTNGIKCENYFNLSLEQLAVIHQRSHLYISHSFHEGFGVPAMDAIQYGIPAVYNACGGQESVLDNIGCVGTTTEALVNFSVQLISDEQARWRLWKQQKQRSQVVTDIFRQSIHKLFVAESSLL